ncbi:pentapeptide repeat-containing protein [Spirillospora sp. NPDC048824]|uniref:pentapeptide repeat-containing protein n=1 Tax=Spirillospora sp. NPDC048824 TaxID=3364526 RepID=UPI00372345A3
MALSIYASSPFFTPSQLHDLAAAVLDANVHDESIWIEWKKTLDDLSGPSARIHLVKAILGFANRDPYLAMRRAGGFAYLLIGVEPENVRGVTTVDHNVLEQSLGPYVGPQVRWTPEYIRINGKNILVIVVDPPQLGDPIHYLRKDLKDSKGKIVHAEHSVFIRRNARTVKANDSDMERLQKRSAPVTPVVATPYRDVDELASNLHSSEPAVQCNSLAILEQIGIDHPSMQQLVIDNVCRLLRTPDDAGVVEAREFAQAVLTRRLTGLDAKNEPVDGGAWGNIDIDLTGARLINLDWQAGSVGVSVFRNAEFLGDTHISGLEFHHSADFSGCTFNGYTAIVGTKFDSCDFSGSTFEDDCIFSKSEVDGMANFTNATFEGGASFRSLTLRDTAIFKDLLFEMNSTFEGAEFHGDAYFDHSHFRGFANFEHVKFHEVISFRNVTSHGELSLARACAFSHLRADLPAGWAINPYGSCVVIARETDILEQDRGKKRPVFGSDHCRHCIKMESCRYL